jgi:hypothetical protein
MSLPSFDERLKMTPEERNNLLLAEVEKVIQNAPPKFHLKLRALQAKLNAVKRKYKDDHLCAEVTYRIMQRGLAEFNEALRGFRT